MPLAPITQEIDLGSLTTSGSNTASWWPSVPSRILKIKTVVTTALTVTSTVITGSIQQADGTAVSPTGAAALGTFTMTTALGVINSVFYKNVDEVSGDIVVYPGEKVALVVTTTSTAGVVRIFLTVEPLSFTDVQQRRSAHVGATDLPTALDGATKLTA